ncbi:unnamed protein product [Ranitomeya imitator]|uniref:Fibronectin type-III domain-containing protein n=1 Tax=Ranitomeya imitator TaxID=111125 RepID=A0ABN9LGS9_9NEOB|nr:unnamed protein product [Ranitomeya imitator]
MHVSQSLTTDSGTYTCVATSSSGETTWSSVLEVTESAGATVSKSYDINDLPGSPSKPQVTDVSKNSVTLSWHLGTPGVLPVTSYIIEAFSQSVSNSWQTVANHVKTTLYTVKGLRPNTIYLFMVRAINAEGLSDPSPMSDPVRTQDISPTVQGVDHRQVQKELGDVIVRLHNPVVLSPTTIQVSWTMDPENPSLQESLQPAITILPPHEPPELPPHQPSELPPRHQPPKLPPHHQPPQLLCCHQPPELPHRHRQSCRPTNHPSCRLTNHLSCSLTTTSAAAH